MDGFWYIIHIYSGHEKKVKMNLEQRVSALALHDEILQVIVPMKEVTSVKEWQETGAGNVPPIRDIFSSRRAMNWALRLKIQIAGVVGTSFGKPPG